jgi:hypothetical protein
MQDLAYAAGLRKPTKTARPEDPSSRLRLVRGATPSSNGLRPVRGATLPSSGPAPLEGSLPLERVPSCSRVRPALGWGPPRSRALRTRALALYLGI